MDLLTYKRTEGLTLTQLSARLGFGVSTVHGWLTGRRSPELLALPQIVQRTGGMVTLADLRPELAPAA